MARVLFGVWLTISVWAGVSADQGWSARAGSFIGRPIASTALAQFQPQTPSLEQRLRRFALNSLKALRRWGIRVSRFLQRTARRWATWMLIALGALLVGAVISAVDRRLFALWWTRGARVAYLYALIGMAVFFRLLRERRVPRLAQLPLVAAVVYGVIGADLIADGALPLGWLDDAALVGIAARWFVHHCPNKLVEEHAAHVRRASERLLA